MIQESNLQFSSCPPTNDNQMYLIPANTQAWTRIEIAGSGTIIQAGSLCNYLNVKFKVINGPYKDYVITQTYYCPQPLSIYLSIYQDLNRGLYEKSALIWAIMESIKETVITNQTLTLAQVLVSKELQHYNNTVCIIKVGVLHNPQGSLFNRNVVTEIL